MDNSKAIPQYEGHTGRELQLMLEGTKPLAMFSDLVFAGDNEDDVDRAFSQFVEQNLFVAHEQRDIWGEPHPIAGKIAIGTRLRLYALKNESWRIPAYLLLVKAKEGRQWSDTLEYCVGSLLGYSDDENVVWIKHIRETHGAWGAAPVYLALTNEDRIKLEELGFKALPVDIQSPIALIFGKPHFDLLASINSTSFETLVRLSLDTRFFLKLRSEATVEVNSEAFGGLSCVRLDHSQIPEVNLNLKANIEIIKPAFRQ